jgi:hypothetical protein
MDYELSRKVQIERLEADATEATRCGGPHQGAR